MSAPTHRSGPGAAWRTRPPRAVVAAGLLVLALTACGGSDSGGSVADDAAGVPRAQDDQDSAGGGSGAAAAVTVPERRISRSQVSVEVDDLARSAQQVRDLAAANGGEVTDESIGLSQTATTGGAGYGSDGSSDDEVRVEQAVTALPGEARLVLRVPPEVAEETANEIAALGTETGRWSSSTSVETTLVDLESRIATQTRAVEQAQTLMDRAASLEDIVFLENEVNSRTAELESLKARMASIEGQADRATVTAVLQTRERTQEVADTSGFLGGLRAGWTALLASLGVLLTVIGAVLPFAVVGLLVGYPAYRLVRHRRENRSARQSPGLVGPQPGFAGSPGQDLPAPPAGPGSAPPSGS